MWLWIIWAAWMSAIIYVVHFYITAAKALQKSKTAEPASAPTAEGVSVIVCARNELANLKQLLPILYRQEYTNFEIVVVDDCSTDGTLDFLLAEKQANPCLKVVWLRHRPAHVRGKKYPLSLGIRAARNERLLLTDADCRPASDQWIRGMTAGLRGPGEIVLGYSPYFRSRGLLNTYIRYETLLTAGLYFSAAQRGRPYMGVGRNLAYRKSLFMRHKGFCGHLHVVGGDDDLFVNRHAGAENTCIATAPEYQVRSFPKEHWGQYFRQKLRHLSVGKYYKKEDQRWLGSLSACHFIFWCGLFGLILGGYEPIFIVTGLILKWFSQFYFLKTTADKLKDPINLALLPIMDFLYVIYYILLGIRAISTKNTQWN